MQFDALCKTNEASNCSSMQKSLRVTDGCSLIFLNEKRSLNFSFVILFSTMKLKNLEHFFRNIQEFWKWNCKLKKSFNHAIEKLHVLLNALHLSSSNPLVYSSWMTIIIAHIFIFCYFDVPLQSEDIEPKVKVQWRICLTVKWKIKYYN